MGRAAERSWFIQVVNSASANIDYPYFLVRRYTESNGLAENSLLYATVFNGKLGTKHNASHGAFVSCRLNSFLRSTLDGMNG